MAQFFEGNAPMPTAAETREALLDLFVSAIRERGDEGPRRHEAARMPGGYGEEQGAPQQGGWIEARALASWYAALFNDLASAGMPPSQEMVEEANDNVQEHGWEIVQDENQHYKALDLSEEEHEEGPIRNKRVPKGTPGAKPRTFKSGGPLGGKQYWVSADTPEPGDQAAKRKARLGGAPAPTPERLKQRAQSLKVSTNEPRKSLGKRKEGYGSKEAPDQGKLAERAGAIKGAHAGETEELSDRIPELDERGELSETGKKKAKNALGAIKRHYGEHTLHRLNEMTDWVEQALGASKQLPMGDYRDLVVSRLLGHLTRIHSMTEHAGGSAEPATPQEPARARPAAVEKAPEQSPELREIMNGGGKEKGALREPTPEELEWKQPRPKTPPVKREFPERPAPAQQPPPAAPTAAPAKAKPTGPQYPKDYEQFTSSYHTPEQKAHGVGLLKEAEDLTDDELQEEIDDREALNATKKRTPTTFAELNGLLTIRKKRKDAAKAGEAAAPPVAEPREEPAPQPSPEVPPAVPLGPVDSVNATREKAKEALENAPPKGEKPARKPRTPAQAKTAAPPVERLSEQIRDLLKATKNPKGLSLEQMAKRLKVPVGEVGKALSHLGTSQKLHSNLEKGSDHYNLNGVGEHLAGTGKDEGKSVATEKAEESRPVEQREVQSAVIQGADELLREKHGVNGMIPLSSLRDMVREQYGEHAASSEAFDAAIYDLVRKHGDAMRVVPDANGSPEWLSLPSDDATSTARGEWDSLARSHRANVEEQEPSHNPKVQGSILKSMQDFLKGEGAKSGLVEIPRLRDAIRQEFGEEAASHKKFDQTLLDLWRKKLVRLTPISDSRKTTPDELQKGVPGMGARLFYAEVPDDMTPEQWAKTVGDYLAEHEEGPAPKPPETKPQSPQPVAAPATPAGAAGAKPQPGSLAVQKVRAGTAYPGMVSLSQWRQGKDYDRQSPERKAALDRTHKEAVQQALDEAAQDPSKPKPFGAKDYPDLKARAAQPAAELDEEAIDRDLRELQEGEKPPELKEDAVNRTAGTLGTLYKLLGRSGGKQSVPRTLEEGEERLKALNLPEHSVEEIRDIARALDVPGAGIAPKIKLEGLIRAKVLGPIAAREATEPGEEQAGEAEAPPETPPAEVEPETPESAKSPEGVPERQPVPVTPPVEKGPRERKPRGKKAAPLTTSEIPPPPEEKRSTPSPAVRKAASGIMEAMESLERGGRNGTPVSLPELRERMKSAYPTKEAFDKAIIDAAKAGYLDLHRHVEPGLLGPGEAETLVDDGEGSHYNVGVVRDDAPSVDPPATPNQEADEAVKDQKEALENTPTGKRTRQVQPRPDAEINAAADRVRAGDAGIPAELEAWTKADMLALGKHLGLERKDLASKKALIAAIGELQPVSAQQTLPREEVDRIFATPVSFNEDIHPGAEVVAQSEDAIKNWTEEEKKDVLDYTHGGYVALNEKMRKCKGDWKRLKGPVKAKMETIERAIARAGEFAEPQQLFRGLRIHDPARYAEYIKTLEGLAESGVAFRFPSITSTTTSPKSLTGYSFADHENPVIFRILARSGVYVDSVSRYKGENEVLQSSGTRYKVHKVAKAKYGTDADIQGHREITTVYLEEIPQHPPLAKKEGETAPESLNVAQQEEAAKTRDRLEQGESVLTPERFLHGEGMSAKEFADAMGDPEKAQKELQRLVAEGKIEDYYDDAGDQVKYRAVGGAKPPVAAIAASQENLPPAAPTAASKPGSRPEPGAEPSHEFILRVAMGEEPVYRPTTNTYRWREGDRTTKFVRENVNHPRGTELYYRQSDGTYAPLHVGKLPSPVDLKAAREGRGIWKTAYRNLREGESATVKPPQLMDVFDAESKWKKLKREGASAEEVQKAEEDFLRTKAAFDAGAGKKKDLTPEGGQAYPEEGGNQDVLEEGEDHASEASSASGAEPVEEVGDGGGEGGVHPAQQLGDETPEPPSEALPRTPAGIAAGEDAESLPDGADVPGDEPGGTPGGQGSESPGREAGGAGAVAADAGSRRGSSGGMGDADGADERNGSSEPATPGERTLDEPPEKDHPTDVSGGNFKYDSPDFFPKGQKAKFQANIEALRTLKNIQAEGRDEATPAEQAVLARFTGWGSLPQLFGYSAEWSKERQQLEGLLSSEEYESARKSTLNAHYTHPEVVQTHWKMAERLGYKGGRFLETSAGIGYYLGMMPPNLAGKTRSSAVELDSLTGQMAKMLYPKANVENTGFEKFDSPHNFYDLVASNVPFGDYKVHDPEYNRHQAHIHDYFFLKSMDLVRPGGLVMHITSTGTLDKANPRIRQELASKGDLVAAIRFPRGAHKENAGTDVVTDLLIFKKRAPGEAPSSDQSWLETTTIPDPAGGEPIPVNRYFAEHPEQVLGTIDRTGSMYHGESVNVSKGADYQDRLQAAIDRLPENVMTRSAAPAKRFAPETAPKPGQTKQGGYLIKDGNAFVREGKEMVETPLDKKNLARVQGMLGVRDALRAVLNLQLEGKDASGARAQLNATYDAFVKAHGVLHEPANRRAFRTDPDSSVLLGLENYDPESKKATKDAVFHKDTVGHVPRVTKAGSVGEALGVSLHESGGVDVAHMAKLTGHTPEEVGKHLTEKGLAYEDPSEGWKPATHYLSGNVRRKLALARAAAANDPRFQANVKALEKVQPEDVEHHEIEVRLGAGWVPPSDIQAFAAHLLEARAHNFDVQYVPQTGTWLAGFAGGKHGNKFLERSKQATEVWGTGRKNFKDLFEAALNNTQVAVHDKDDEGKSVLNRQATDDANAKIGEIKEAFREWVWDDEERRTRLHRYYNDNFNNIRHLEYDGSHQTFPGKNPAIELRDHQKNFIWQTVTTGRGLAAHEVGTGKTYTMIASAMEQRRLGLARKPAILCKPANIESMTRDALKLYPGARIISTADVFDAKSRKQTIAKIATGDYDMVFMTHDQFDLLKMKPEVTQKYIRKEMDELRAAIVARQEGGAGKSDRVVKQLEKAQAKLEAKLKDALDDSGKDDAVFFEETGIDSIFVDEAHRYKSLPVVTKQQQMKGVPTSRSDRATNMHMVTQWLLENNNGRGVVFATGTPVANTMAELYTMQRYLQPEELKERGIDNFDAWAAAFGDVVTKNEFSVTGEYKSTSRFAKFVNIPELMQITRQIMDVQRADDMVRPDGRPVLVRPKRRDSVIAAPKGEAMEGLMKSLQERARELKGRSGPGTDNMLAICTDGRKGALDMRLLNANAPDDPESKVNHAIRNVLRLAREKPGTTQLIFSDIGVNPTEQGFHLYGDVIEKLVQGGIPRERIADFSKLEGVKKEAAMAAMRTGQILIGIGSTEKLGTGVNVQHKLAALHHLDVPWLPASVEQRDGRAWRQGNENKDVDIFRYVSEGSLDQTFWQIIGNKTRFIKQVVAQKENKDRVARDEDTEELTPEQLMAAASGNPRILEKVNLDSELKTLQAAKQRHEREQIKFKDAVASIERNVPHLERAAAQKRKDAQFVEANPEYRLAVGGQTFDKSTKDAREAWDQRLKDNAGEIVDSRSWNPFLMASFKGMDVISEAGKFYLRLPTGEKYPTGDSLGSVEHVARQIPRWADEADHEVKRAREDAEKVKRNIGKTFARAQELEEKRKRAKEIDAELAKMGKPEEKPPEAEQVVRHRRRWLAREYGRQGNGARFLAGVRV